MAYFNMDLLTDEGVPIDVQGGIRGRAMTGTMGLHRNVVQFMNGAPIVDQGSLAYTPAGVPSTGQVLAIDSRAGDQLDTVTTGTSGYTPNVAETWTLTFLTASTFSVSGSVSGAQGNGTVGIDYVVKDLIYIKIVDAGVDPYIVGDVYTIDFLSNPNTTGKWLDPNPQNGYILDGGVIPAQEFRGGETTTKDILNYRLMYSDPVGSSNPLDYYYMAVGAYDGEYATHSGAVDLEAGLWFQGTRGYAPDGNHAEQSSGRYITTARNTLIHGALVCDSMHFKCMLLMALDVTMGYVGSFETYTTRDEYQYPFVVIGNTNSPTLWTQTSQWATLANSTAYTSNSVQAMESYGPGGGWTDAYTTATIPDAPATIWPFQNTQRPYQGRQAISVISPPQSGGGEILLLPAQVTNFYSPGSNYTNGSQTNYFLGTQVYGELIGVYGVNANVTNETDIIDVSGVEYQCAGGPLAATNTYYPRAAFKLE